MAKVAIVGGGIGGCCAGVALSKDHQVTLFEKDSALGGCSGTFYKNGHYYNTGATTFAGYDEGNIVWNFFSKHSIEFPKKRLSHALCVMIGDQKIYRYEDFESFFEEINKAFPNPANKDFWSLIYTINKKFYTFQNYYYSEQTLFHKALSMVSFRELLGDFYPYLFKNARKYIFEHLGDSDPSYLDFLDNQCLIVSQAKTDELNFLTAALALGYHFMGNYYIYGGMGNIFEACSNNIYDVRLKHTIQKIYKTKQGFKLYTKNNSFETQKLILNSTIFDSSALFDDPSIVNYFKKYQHLQSNKSAFVLYLTLKEIPQISSHHIQIICEKELIHTISNSIFVSFGDKEDPKMARSVTVSVHTTLGIWEDGYKEKKEELSQAMLTILKERLQLDSSMIEVSFGATPKTFKRYINRSNLGGIPVTQSNLFYKIPSNITPIPNLYLVGDTSYAAQGWMGVMMGVRNLERLL